MIHHPIRRSFNKILKKKTRKPIWNFLAPKGAKRVAVTGIAKSRLPRSSQFFWGSFTCIFFLHNFLGELLSVHKMPSHFYVEMSSHTWFVFFLLQTHSLSNFGSCNNIRNEEEAIGGAGRHLSAAVNFALAKAVASCSFFYDGSLPKWGRDECFKLTMCRDRRRRHFYYLNKPCENKALLLCYSFPSFFIPLFLLRFFLTRVPPATLLLFWWCASWRQKNCLVFLSKKTRLKK